MFKKAKTLISLIVIVAMMMTVCLPCFNAFPVSAAQYAYNSWDFEDLELGSSLPSPFTNENNGTYSIATDPADAENQCLKVEDTTVNRASTNLSFTKMYEEFTFEFKFRFDSLNMGTTISFANSLSVCTQVGHAVALYVADNGRIYVMNGSAEQTVKETYTAGDWVSVKFVIDPAANTWDFYFNEGKDDAVTLNDLKFRGSGYTYLSYFHFGPWSTRKGTYYIDDVTAPKERVKISLDRYIPEYNEVEILYDANVETAETDPDHYARTYLAFPTIQKISDEKVVIVYKRGVGHAWNVAHDEIMVYNPITEQIVSRDILYNVDGENPQNPELAKMPNGDLVAFLDRQTPTNPLDSLGVRLLRSTDNGETWVLDKGNTTDEYTNNDEYALLQDTDGVQYMTNYEDVVVGNTIYMIATTSTKSGANLGGVDIRGNSVNIIKSDDNGATWTHITNLTALAGIAINESSFVKLSNGDFFFVCRGDDERTVVMRTDSEFNLIKKTIISDDYYSLNYIGRPKVFEKDGEYYLICRNVRSDANEELALYRFDTENLVPETYVVIEEPMTSSRAGMGHYAEPYFITQDGVEYLNIINYTDAYTGTPDLVRYELKWDEIKDPSIKQETEAPATTAVATPVTSASVWNSDAPVYESELSNLSLAFEYTAKSDAVWYFDVVDGDYDNCYSVELTPSGMTLNRIVGGEKTALSTYTGFESGKYYEIKLIRYMGDIKVYVGKTLAMSVAEEDKAYPVVTGDVKTHWKGNLYLDDNGAVTNIKVYDSGLITFDGNVAKLGSIKIKDDISAMILNGTSTVTTTEDSIRFNASGISNASAYTSAWLDNDVGDFVLTYSDMYYRENWCNHALIFAATPTAEPGYSQYFQGYNSGSFDIKNVFDGGYALVTGISTLQTRYTFHTITAKSKYTTLTPVTSVGTFYRPYNVKVVKKADRLIVTIGNDRLGYKTVYDGTSNHMVGNIFAAVQQDTSYITNIKVTDTVNAVDTVLTEDTTVAGDLSKDTVLNADDLTLMKKHLLGLFIPDALGTADVNTDRYVDIRDIIRLKKNMTK